MSGSCGSYSYRTRHFAAGPFESAGVHRKKTEPKMASSFFIEIYFDYTLIIRRGKEKLPKSFDIRSFS